MIDSITFAMNEVAKYIIPLLLIGIPMYALSVKKVKVYEVFVVGAKDGFTIAVRIIPYLVAILVAVGMPLFSGVAANNRATTQANTFLTAFKLARSEAVKTGDRATVCPKDDPDPANLECGDATTWANGWMVHRGAAVATVDAANLVRIWEAPNSVTITTAVNALTFTSSGELEGIGAIQTITMRVEGCASGDRLQRQITVTPVGQVQTARGVCP